MNGVPLGGDKGGAVLEGGRAGPMKRHDGESETLDSTVVSSSSSSWSARPYMVAMPSRALGALRVEARGGREGPKTILGTHLPESTEVMGGGFWLVQVTS